MISSLDKGQMSDDVELKQGSETALENSTCSTYVTRDYRNKGGIWPYMPVATKNGHYSGYRRQQHGYRLATDGYRLATSGYRLATSGYRAATD